MGSSRAVLLLLNGFFFLIGIAILSIGMWSQFDKNFSSIWGSFEINKVIDARGLNGASLLLIISGLLSVLISFIGLYGSVRNDKCFLTTYCLLILIIILLEITAISLFFSFKSETQSHLRQGLNETVAKVNKDQDKAALQVMNSIQTVFKCCGCDGPSDYVNVSIVDSCRTAKSTPEKPDYYNNGCYPTIIQYVDSHLPIILGVGICMVIFQMFCLIISIKTCCQKRPEGYEDI